jgi:hypothetical protein
MGGRFSRDNRPLLPGAYFNVEAVQQTVIPPSTGQIVAVPIVHTWGPVKTPTLVSSAAQFEAVFGRDLSPGRTAVINAFRGEDVPGWGGAGAVLVYRIVGSAGAKASRTLADTAGSPATAVTVTAKYEGSRGNRLAVGVVDTAGDSTSTDLIVYDGTVELERYTFIDADTQALVTAINDQSDWISATRQGAGPLALHTTPVSLTSGDDGATLVSGDWTSAMSALEIERFGLLAPYDLTDSAILASLKTWARDLNRAGKRFRTVVGGGSSDSASTAISRTASLQDTTYPDAPSDFVNLGGFQVEDSMFGVLTSSQLASRYAGILAQRGEVHSATAARLGGVTRIVSGPTKAEEVQMFKGGVVSVGRDSDPTAPIRFGAAVTAYTVKANTQFPYTIFRNPKFVGTMHGIEMEVTEYAETQVIGKTVVNNKTRDALVGEMTSRMLARVQAGVIQPNPTVEIDQDPPPSDDDEFIALVYGVKFGRTAEQVYGTLRVG